MVEKMKSSDEPLSDSEKMKFMRMFQMMKNQPGFAEFFSKTPDQSSQKESDGARSEPTVTSKEGQDPKLKATLLEDDLDRELDLKNDFIYEERSRSLAHQSKFYKAVSLYEMLETEDEDDIGMKLLAAECYIQLGRENKAEKAIKSVEKILMTNPMCDVDDVTALAEDAGKKDFVRSLILLRIAGEIVKKSPDLSPDEKVGRMFQCITKMRGAVGKMLNQASDTEGLQGVIQNLFRLPNALTMGEGGQDLNLQSLMNVAQQKTRVEIKERVKVIALDYGLAVMEEMQNDMWSIEGANEENKALKQAILANMINFFYSNTGQHAKAYKSLVAGQERMKQHFGRNANQHQIYLILLLNIGAELHNSEKFKEAEDIVQEALDSVDYVLDFTDEGDRQSMRRRVASSLSIVRNHVKLG